MDEIQPSELLKIVESPDFKCFQCIYYLSLYGNNVGISHFLVKKLSTFLYSEIEFYIPQLIQILISFESNSMALPDFILEQSRKSPHFCLLAFWNLQAYVSELKNEPDSYSFHVVRNFINSLQDIMFNQHSLGNDQIQFRENLHPALVLCASVAASMAMPNIHTYIKPIVSSQGRQQKSFLFKLANFHKSLTRNLTLKNRGRPLDLGTSDHPSADEDDNDEGNIQPQRYSESIISSSRRPRSSSSFGLDSDTEEHYASDYSGVQGNKKNYNIHAKKNFARRISSSSLQSSIAQKKEARMDYLNSHSMPDLTGHEKNPLADDLPLSSLASEGSSTSLSSLAFKTSKLTLSYEDDSKLLRVNYFKKETEFMMVLQNISLRLSLVPKEARLTSLRAELSIINNMHLPSQIDIPQLLPSSSMPNRKYHRILKLNVNEACVLNSAERVPYLLLIEYLNEDMDFDPSTEQNKSVLMNQASKSFTTPLGSPNVNMLGSPSSVTIDASEEADLGDISVVALSNQQTHFSNQLQARIVKGLKSNADLENSEADTRDEEELKVPHVTGGNSHKDLSTQIRIAAVMLKQLEKAGRANTEQSEAIKARIVKSMKALQNEFETIDYEQIKELSAHTGNDGQDAGERKLENDFKIGEDWATKRARIRKTSPYGHLPHWDLCSVIVKNGDDLQQEAFACQLISVISNIWKSSGVGVWTKNMKIVVTSSNSGLVETINNALSVHSIKKTMTEISIQNGSNPRGTVASIKDYFLKVYGNETSPKFKKAQENFARSLAAYSIICYVLQIKDRHNGNIMLDNEGHIMHIDFGFILSNSPGSVGFEAAPFKLSLEYVDVLGGVDSVYFRLFTQLCQQAFLALRESCDTLINLVDIMQKDSSLPCFKSGTQTKVLLKQRLQLDLSDEECNNFVESVLIGKSMGSMYTRLYDQFQLLTQGIYS
uniref:1-phosphatidylinositol 4-kinase n=2 Tax=Clavispora lusitaniae TaxID=36911 RepID=C5HU29_CLALS|nr:pik1 [Clavispora lusitaniae]